MTTTGELATETQRSTRSVRHLVVDVALGTLMIALCGLVFLATPGPWLCPASNPTPFPCNQGDRDLIALITIISVLILLGVGVLANHLLRGRARSVTLLIAAGTALTVGLLGLSSLVLNYWIIHPWRLPVVPF